MTRPALTRLVLLLLLLAAPARAAELKLATWNLEWLTLRPAGDPALPDNVRPKSADAHAALQRYARQLDADVVAFQEVDGADAARFLSTLKERLEEGDFGSEFGV